MAFTRTDIHRPSAIVPADYDYVAFEFVPPTGDPLGDAYANLAERQAIKAHMVRTGGTYANHAHGGNCMVCGAHAIYTILFHHRPSNTYVRMGQDCAAKCECAYDEAGWNSFRRAAGDARKAAAGKAKAKAVLTDRGLAAAWDIYTSKTTAAGHEESTINDVVGKLVTYGNLSDKQYNFIGFLLGKIANRAQIEAARKAATAAALPVPEGRIEITGEVVSTKVVDTDFGVVTKMLVKAADGWKVWGTMPRSLSAERGNTVRFVATVTPSKDDTKFGFFSRPTKAEVVGG